MRVGVLLLLGACVENGLAPSVGPDGEVLDTGEPVGEGLAETCNGEDDDGDGLVDEDWGDLDGDGVLDCFDSSCEVDIAAARDASLSEDCLFEPPGTVTDPWDVATEWVWTEGGVFQAPMVGQLTDDDGNGSVDDHDDPDLVFVVNVDGGTIVALDGATGAEHWRAGPASTYSGIALADVDADGSPDVVALDPGKRAIAYDRMGAPLWRSSAASGFEHPQVQPADLDGDGMPEIVQHHFVLDGLTGAVEATLPTPTSRYSMPAIGDLDLDGEQEIILPPHAYDRRGNLLWTSPAAGSYGHFAAIVDVDGDPEGEVIVVGSESMAIHDADGRLISAVSFTEVNQPGPPCVADFDGDGAAEIAWPSQRVLRVRELDGTVTWEAPIADYSGLAGCSGYDVDADGAYEVLFADEGHFWIFDGRTGAKRYETGHSSMTLFEYPVVADIDGDDSAEIVLASNRGITVLGQADDGWLASGPTWGIHDFAVGNLGADGSVPLPEPWWQTYNVYRARPAVDVVEPAPDLLVTITDVCVASCETGPAEIAWQVENVGPLDVPAGAVALLYATVDGAEVPLDSRVLPEIPSGRALPGDVFTVLPRDVPEGAWGIRVDATRRIRECRESNNLARGQGLCAP